MFYVLPVLIQKFAFCIEISSILHASPIMPNVGKYKFRRKIRQYKYKKIIKQLLRPIFVGYEELFKAWVHDIYPLPSEYHVRV